MAVLTAPVYASNVFVVGIRGKIFYSAVSRIFCFDYFLYILLLSNFRFDSRGFIFM